MTNPTNEVKQAVRQAARDMYPELNLFPDLTGPPTKKLTKARLAETVRSWLCGDLDLCMVPPAFCAQIAQRIITEAEREGRYDSIVHETYKQYDYEGWLHQGRA